MTFKGVAQSIKFLSIEVVDFASLIADSAKLKELDRILKEKKKRGDRVLIFCQMTKMLDILEDFMNKKKYSFFRLDGSLNIADRRDMVNEFQTNPKIFAFLLSTRAGIIYSKPRWTWCYFDSSKHSYLLRQ
jgi:DNA helicase INO80